LLGRTDLKKARMTVEELGAQRSDARGGPTALIQDVQKHNKHPKNLGDFLGATEEVGRNQRGHKGGMGLVDYGG